MTNAQAQATADRLNVTDAGVLVYKVLTIGADALVMVYDAAGNFLGEL